MPLEQNGRALRTWVGTLQDMRQAIYELMRDELAICGACDQPAKRIDFQDAAEWYLHCMDHHYGFGEQWTGSTRFMPHDLWVVVYPDKVQAWLDAGDDERRKKWHIETYDDRDLYDLMPEWGEREEDRRILYEKGDVRWQVDIAALTNGEYAYSLHMQRGNVGYGYGLVGTFASADEALQHALASEDVPQYVRDAQ